MAIFNGNNRYVVVLNGTRYVDKYTLPRLSDNWIQASAATGTWNNPSYTLSFNKLIWDVGGHIEYKYGSDAEWTVLSTYQSTFVAPANVRCMQVQAAGTGFYNSSTFNSGNFANPTTSTPTITVDSSEMTMTIHNTSFAFPIGISTSCTGHSITYSDTIAAGASKVVDYSTWISTTCATNGYTVALSGTANNSDVSSHGDTLKSNSVGISASLSKQQLTDTLAVNSTDTWISHYIKVTHSAVPSGVTPILHYKLGNDNELTRSDWATDGSISFTTANCKTITYYTSANKRYNSTASTTVAANPDSPAIQLTVCADTHILSMYNPSSYNQSLSLTGTICGTSFDYSRTIGPKKTSTQSYLVPSTTCASTGQPAQFNGHGTNHIVCTSYSENLVGNDIDTNTVNFEKKKCSNPSYTCIDWYGIGTDGYYAGTFSPINGESDLLTEFLPTVNVCANLAQDVSSNINVFLGRWGGSFNWTCRKYSGTAWNYDSETVSLVLPTSVCLNHISTSASAYFDTDAEGYDVLLLVQNNFSAAVNVEATISWVNFQGVLAYSSETAGVSSGANGRIIFHLDQSEPQLWPSIVNYSITASHLTDSANGHCSVN